MYQNLLVLVFMTAFSWNAVFGQKTPLSKDQVMQAIRSGAEYASTVLLDENGKSRCDYFMTEGRWNPCEPAWHTGQLVNALVEVHKLTKEDRYLIAAKKAADWWLGLEIKDRPQFQGMVLAIHEEDTSKRNVFSTISDGTPGLFNLYRLTGEKKYAELPTSAGEWMLRHMYLPQEGLFYDMLDYGSGDVLKLKESRKADKEQQSLNDIARPNNEGFLFKDMYKYTRNEEYKKVFINLCESLVAKQGLEGLWMDFAPNNAEEGSFHPRFNLWYAESLIEGYELTGDARYLDAARKTVQCYIKHQKKDGTFRYRTYLDGRSKEDSFAGSATSFIGLLALRIQRLGAGEGFTDVIDRCARWVIATQFPATHADKNLAGAFLDFNTQVKSGKLTMIQRDVGTSFALRFLAAYSAFKFE